MMSMHTGEVWDMLFFTAEADSLVGKQGKQDAAARDELIEQFLPLLERFLQQQERKAYGFVSGIRKGKVKAGLIIRSELVREQGAAAIGEAFLACLEISFERIRVEETTLKAMQAMMRLADQKNHLDEDTVYQQLGIEEIMRRCRRHGGLTERLIPAKCAKDALLKQCGELMLRETLAPELERICQGAALSVREGHPVHYLIRTDDDQLRGCATEILMAALYANGRVLSRRYSRLVLEDDDDFDGDDVEAAYDACRGGAIVLRYTGGGVEEGSYASRNTGWVESVCETVRKYRHSVLTVLSLPVSCANVQELLDENLRDITLVEIREDMVYGEQAASCLARMARDVGLTPDEELTLAAALNQDGRRMKDLRVQFERWYSGRLKTAVYRQYAMFDSVGSQAVAKPAKGSAYEKLMQMPGLESAKGVIRQALDFAKVQAAFCKEGDQASRPALHMSFTGNPGTAKTTAARLFAQIMKDNHLLSVGDLYEVGRADLVGKYVGWTAPLVKKAFAKARGSVLFIDEAYSLVDDRDGMYGDEAIHTIVQEMENRREDQVVIFAGYPDKMEDFLNRNPGLRSRVAFHVPFSDYTPRELLDIAELMADGMGIRLAQGVRERLEGIFAQAVCTENFGNGRFARSLLEQARMRQASRILSQGIDKVTCEVTRLLLPEDFAPAFQKPANPKRLIGFGQPV